MKCPKCKKDDNVRKISVVLDEGTTTSQTLGFNVPINNHKKHQNDAFSVSTFSTTSQSVLVSRLLPPAKPRQKWKHFNLIIYILYFLPMSFYFNNDLSSVNNFESTLGLFVFILPALITKLISQFFSNKKWALIWNRFRFIIYVIYYILLFFWAMTVTAGYQGLKDDYFTSTIVSFDLAELTVNFVTTNFFAFPIFVLVSFIVQLKVQPSKQVLGWQESLNDYRSSFYCFRDDICFNEQLNENPEQFKTKLFK